MSAGSVQQKIKRIEEDDPTLTAAEFSRTNLQPGEVELLAEALQKNTNLERLFLGATGLGVSGLEVLAPAIAKHRALVEVHLGGNNIEDEGVIHLLPQLSDHPTLKKLALNSNGITDVGVGAITRFLEINDTIDWLWLESNDFGEEGSKAIESVLTKKGGCYLQICGGGHWGDLIRSRIKRSTDASGPHIRVVTESSRYVESKNGVRSYPLVRCARGPLALAIQCAIYMPDARWRDE